MHIGGDLPPDMQKLPGSHWAPSRPSFQSWLQLSPIARTGAQVLLTVVRFEGSTPAQYDPGAQ